MMYFSVQQPRFSRRPLVNADHGWEQFLSHAVYPASHSAPVYSQDEGAFYLALDLPGIGRDQLSISIEAAAIRVQSREGSPRNYRAAYEFPMEIDANLSEAKLENGVLRLKLAKKVPVDKAVALEIQ
jgi:HSP20 family molecular chaperone IbpA